jgi:hypothetical protein
MADGVRDESEVTCYVWGSPDFHLTGCGLSTYFGEGVEKRRRVERGRGSDLYRR